MILKDTIKQGSQLLRNHNILSHEIDAQIILSNSMGVTREFLLLNENISISDKIRIKFNYLLKRRINNEPVAYITGKKEFWTSDFLVNKSTLVPRPETELLIYKIVDFYKGIPFINASGHQNEDCQVQKIRTPTFFF